MMNSLRILLRWKSIVLFAAVLAGTNAPAWSGEVQPQVPPQETALRQHNGPADVPYVDPACFTVLELNDVVEALRREFEPELAQLGMRFGAFHDVRLERTVDKDFVGFACIPVYNPLGDMLRRGPGVLRLRSVTKGR